MLTDKPLAQQDVHGMIRRRAKEAGIETLIGCHTFRATGITMYLQNGGPLEIPTARAICRTFDPDRSCSREIATGRRRDRVFPQKIHLYPILER